MKYKYQFKALFEDGEEFIQHPEDKSLIDPDKRSSFFDYLSKCNQVKPIKFYLYNKDTEYCVDLTNGNFSFKKGETSFILKEDRKLQNFRVIYFRSRVVNFNVGFKIKSQELEGFKLGWQATDDNGNNIQKQLEIL